ncbi:hypothetical protein DY000_02060421 [Brassica cretica]|uniref:Uncharacterized protein n=1 Tax=Brassica cretica TaxID=69181 RepID=A0ABQ7ANE8_BRACR|nr:hypothetical protein DY000_02060421 [Brassica cretica]
MLPLSVLRYRFCHLKRDVGIIGLKRDVGFISLEQDISFVLSDTFLSSRSRQIKYHRRASSSRTPAASSSYVLLIGGGQNIIVPSSVFVSNEKSGSMVFARSMVRSEGSQRVLSGAGFKNEFYLCFIPDITTFEDVISISDLAEVGIESHALFLISDPTRSMSS